MTRTRWLRPRALSPFLVTITLTALVVLLVTTACSSTSSSATSSTRATRHHALRSLRTFQEAVCFDQKLELKCPPQSAINVLYAHIGMTAKVEPGDEGSEMRSSEALPKGCPGLKSSRSGITLASGSTRSTGGGGNRSSSVGSPSFPGLAESCAESADVAGIIQSLCRHQSQSRCTFRPSDSEVLTKINVCHYRRPRPRESTIDAGHDEDENYVSSEDTLGLPFIELAFRCRPTNLTRIVCEGTVLDLTCRTGHVVVVHEALFGPSDSVNEKAKCHRMSEGETPRKPLCSFVPVRKVHKRCHGRQNCSLDTRRGDLKVDEDKAACPESRVTKPKRSKGHILRVEYTCAPKAIYQKRPDLDTSAPEDSVATSLEFTQRPAHRSRPGNSGDSDFPVGSLERRLPEIGRNPEFPEPRIEAKREQPTVSREPVELDILELEPEATEAADADDEVLRSSTPLVNCTTITYLSEPPPTSAGGFSTDWLSAYVFITRNLERLALYLLVSVLGALMAFFAVLSCKLYCSKRRVLRRISDDLGACPPLAVFVDDDQREPSTGDPLVSTVHRHHHQRHRRLDGIRRSGTLERASRRTSGPGTLYSPSASSNGHHQHHQHPNVQPNCPNGHHQVVVVSSHQASPTLSSPGLHYSTQPSSVRYATLANFRSTSEATATPSPRDEDKTRGTTPSRSTNASMYSPQSNIEEVDLIG